MGSSRVVSINGLHEWRQFGLFAAVEPHVGGAPVRDAADLQRRIALLQAGETADFAVSRRGNMLTVRATTAERGFPRIRAK
jgi:hypothetical protein